MPLTEASKLRYVKERSEPRDVRDLTASELFLTDPSQCDNYSEASDSYRSYLESEVRKSSDFQPNTRAKSGQSVSDVEVYRMHRSKANNWDVSNILPRGSSLEDSLQTDMFAAETWQQPNFDKTFKPSEFFLSTINLRNFNLDFFLERKKVFLSNKIHQETTTFASKALPFSVETIKISRSEYGRLIKLKDSQKVVQVLADLQDDNLVEVPTKFIIGDGETGSLVFSFGFVEVEQDDPNSNTRNVGFNRTIIPTEVLDFWDTLPALYSFQGTAQYTILSDFLNTVYDVDMVLNVFNLEALAVVSGCKMDMINMFTLSVAVTGKPFPPGLDIMDNIMATPTRNLPGDVQLYLQEKTTLFFRIYKTLMGSLLRQTFPDPDIVLSVTEMTQSTFIAWFCEFVARAVHKSHIDDSQGAYKQKTRADMIKSLYRSVSLGQLADLMNNVPVPQCGGERYLHHARDVFIKQYEVLKGVQFSMYASETPNTSKTLDTSRLLYNRELQTDDSGTPALQFGLLAGPKFSDIFNLDPRTDCLVSFQAQFGRPLVVSIEEWGRLNPSKIPVIFSRLRKLYTNDLAKFWVPKIRAYEVLRGIYYRLTGIKEAVCDLDKVLTTKLENTRKHYNEVEAVRLRAANQVRRVDLLSHESEFASSTYQLGAHQYVHDVIPGDNTERNRKRRMKRQDKKQDLKAAKLAKSEEWIPKSQIDKEKMMRPLVEKDLNPKERVSRPSEPSSSLTKPSSTKEDDVPTADNLQNQESSSFPKAKSPEGNPRTNHYGDRSKHNERKDYSGSKDRDYKDNSRYSHHSRRSNWDYRDYSRSGHRDHAGSSYRDHSRSSHRDDRSHSKSTYKDHGGYSKSSNKDSHKTSFKRSGGYSTSHYKRPGYVEKALLPVDLRTKLSKKHH